VSNKTLIVILVALAALVIVIQALSLAFPAERSHTASMEEATLVPRPTRTSTPTQTLPPPTATATATMTRIPPTATEPPPTATATATGLPETPTPSATATARPTNTRAATAAPPTAVPPTPLPPTATAAPETLLTQVEINNGEWGTNAIYVRYDGAPSEEVSDILVKGSDGGTYRAELGFLSRPSSLARIQEYWSYAARGGANWKGFVRLYDSPNWATCSAQANVCYQKDENPAQAAITSQIYIKPHVWESLLKDYMAGGMLATLGNGYYYEIQNAVFRPIIDIAPPGEPCVVVRFVRVS